MIVSVYFPACASQLTISTTISCPLGTWTLRVLYAGTELGTGSPIPVTVQSGLRACVCRAAHSLRACAHTLLGHLSNNGSRVRCYVHCVLMAGGDCVVDSDCHTHGDSSAHCDGNPPSRRCDCTTWFGGSLCERRLWPAHALPHSLVVFGQSARGMTLCPACLRLAVCAMQVSSTRRTRL